jgi:nucleotide-binding universal stress UspA family protein
MYRRVLVPLDGSQLAESILPFAEQVAGPSEAEIVLLRVIEPLSAGEVMASAGFVTPDTVLARELDAKQYLAGVERRLKAKGFRVDRRLQLGRAADEILTMAQATGADLIAMTTHGRSGIGRLLFGSVAEAVLRASPVPILIRRVTAEAPKATATPP